MTYSESAKGLTITHERAVEELKRHGISLLDQFHEDMGKQEHYDAYEVLEWLGY